jgi:hypothetical protein
MTGCFDLFLSWRDSGTKYDFRGKLTVPASALMPGGYSGILDPKTGQWTQVTARLPNDMLSPRSQHRDRTVWHASAEWRKHYRLHD